MAGSRTNSSGQATAGKRLDRDGAHRKAFESNKAKIYATQSVCGICGRPVDFTVPWPDPMSACIDHIIPVDKGGHPSDMANLQLAHMACNRQKSDKLLRPPGQAAGDQPKLVNNRELPQSMDWAAYRHQ